MQLHTAHYGNANVFGYSIHTENWHTVINIHSKYGRNSNCSMGVFSLGMLSMLNTVRVCWGSIWMCRNRLFKGKDVNICAPLWVGTPSVVCWITRSLCVQHSHWIKGWSMGKRWSGIGCWGLVGLTVFILTSFCWAVCCCLATSHFFFQRDVFCECADTMLNVAKKQWLS